MFAVKQYAIFTLAAASYIMWLPHLCITSFSLVIDLILCGFVQVACYTGL